MLLLLFMPFEPKFTITPKLARALMRIEAAKQAIQDLPITPSVLATLRERARLFSTHYSTLIEGRAIGDRRGEAITLNNIGNVYESIGEWQKALEKFKEALPIRREIGDRRGEAITGFARLAFTRYEAESIFRMIPMGTGLKATDFAASRELVLSSQLNEYRILHFATHGLLNGEHPELSGLVFSLVDREGRAQDGYLRLHEVYNLELNADLVVLSACRTGLGKEIKGEWK
jgi:CHAT domain-containing protein